MWLNAGQQPDIRRFNSSLIFRIKMSRLEEAQNKLRFADYLLQREDSGFQTGAMKHILQAANLVVAELLAIDEKSSISPFLVKKKLDEGSQQEREFSAYFLELWKMTINPALSRQDVANAYKRVKTFLDYVKGVRAGI